MRLKRWIEPLGISPSSVSLHVVEATDPAATVLDLAHSNHVDLIILGAPGASSRALAWWRSVASGVTGGRLSRKRIEATKLRQVRLTETFRGTDSTGSSAR